MLESILIRDQKGSVGNMVDLGSLAEALIYYGEVRVLAKKYIIEELLLKIGPGPLIRLLETGILKLIYEFDMIGIHTRSNENKDEIHSPVIFHAVNDEPDEAFRNLLFSLTGQSGKSRRIAKKIQSLVKIIDRNDDLINAFYNDLDNKEYINNSIKELLRLYVPEYTIPHSFNFQVKREDKSFKIATNLDFQEINNFYHLRIPKSDSSIANAYLMNHLLDARENSRLCAEFKSDIYIDSINRKLLELCFSSIIQKTDRNIKEIEIFQNFNFENSKAIREAVNSGHINFLDIVKLVEKSLKFKEWISEKADDHELIKEYFKEVNSGSLIDKIPGKTVRWSFFTTAGFIIGSAVESGLVGTGAGIALSAFDAFVLDLIAKGWKPNLFIDSINRVFKYITNSCALST
ncbi:hypothetical protein [Leptospira sp. GIMC2001]|uniref:hypothetical protein n=1 Tax=Leptospira sp. GIMC2001 TaxID=1513297 RepID=UPI00234B3357|nr:hypothetical protein [Leptospira sp. GIMC2001]WCL50650.1 hypothetical protein O4O04_07510 [Leptospira sp. GIMC2001]